MAMSAGHSSKFASIHRQWWRFHMSEKFSSGTKIPKQTNWKFNNSGFLYIMWFQTISKFLKRKIFKTLFIALNQVANIFWMQILILSIYNLILQTYENPKNYYELINKVCKNINILEFDNELTWLMTNKNVQILVQVNKRVLKTGIWKCSCINVVFFLSLLSYYFKINTELISWILRVQVCQSD